MAGRIRRHWKGLLAGAVVLAAVLIIGVPWVYIHLIEGEQPAPLSLSDVAEAGTTGTSSRTTPPAGTGSAPGAGTSQATTASTSTDPAGSGATADDGLEGTWTVGAGSQAGYRVQETLAGQGTEAVGRTDQVTGTITISDGEITAVDITVQVAAIASDNSQRDRQFQGRIMDAARHPTATFTLTEPIPLTEVPAVDAEIALSATGELTLHGTTRPVTIPLSVLRTADSLAANGSLEIAYADYGINNPSVPGFVSVGEAGTVEFLVVATRS